MNALQRGIEVPPRHCPRRRRTSATFSRDMATRCRRRFQDSHALLRTRPASIGQEIEHVCEEGPMRSVVCKHARLRRRRPARAGARLGAGPPGGGALRICGSDLHARHGLDQWADMAKRSAMGASAGRISRSSSATSSRAPSRSTAPAAARTFRPVRRRRVASASWGNGIDPHGLSVEAPGGYSEQVIGPGSLMLRVPTGSPRDVAALTEPMAVAWHAVRRGEVRKRTVAIVIGCGPVGLGVILCLEGKGVATVVAADFSPGRRALAKACGADIVVDPGEGSPYTAFGWKRAYHRRAGCVRAGRRDPREARTAAGRVVARLAARRGTAQVPSNRRLRMCGRARRDREHHRGRATVLTRRRGRRLRRRRPVHPGDGDQQGDRSALRARRTPRWSSATRSRCESRARSIHGR